jgi:hypothetical protein
MNGTDNRATDLPVCVCLLLECSFVIPADVIHKSESS